MSRNDPDLTETPINKAKIYALYLLNFRNRSQREIEEKLRRKNFSNSVIDQTIEFLKKKRFIDDAQFVRDWIKARLDKPYGLNRIAFELRTKGIDPDLIQEAVAHAKENFPEEEIVLSLAQKQARKYAGLEKNKLRQRVFGYLSRRGFSSQAIQSAVMKLC